jgi:hypothetical protein
MRNFRLAGACIVLSLLVGCAGTGENNQITKDGFAHMQMDAARSKPQYQCPPPGLPSPEICVYKLKVFKDSNPLQGQVARSVIEQNQQDCLEWNTGHPDLPSMTCPDPDTYRYFRFQLPIEGDLGSIGEEEVFENDPATGKLKKSIKKVKKKH